MLLYKGVVCVGKVTANLVLLLATAAGHDTKSTHPNCASEIAW